jgi:hypothetical protein
MIALLYFIAVFFVLLMLRNRSIALVLIGIQIVSLMGTFFLGREYSFDTFFKIFNLTITLVLLSMIIIPWMKVVNVKEIYSFNELKLKRLTRFLIGLSIMPFITFLVVSYFVIFLVKDINTFKYAEGVSTDFYYGLPLNIKLLIFSNYLYNFSYFLIPLHFYYLAKKNYWLSFFCFLFSLNIILYGLTYFSRSVYIQYGSIYGSVLFILFGTLEHKVKNFIKFVSIIVVSVFMSYFIYISNERFVADTSYDDLIPTNAIVQDQVNYSYLDYGSQWYFNNFVVLEKYDFKGFNGQISLQPVLSILGQYGLINYDPAQYTKLRIQLWPDHYWTFNGFVAYSIYDYGYFLSLIFCLFYFFLVRFNSPIKNTISIVNLFVIVLLIQLPLMAVFYSNVGTVLLPLLFLAPIYLYLKITFKSYK